MSIKYILMIESLNFEKQKKFEFRKTKKNEFQSIFQFSKLKIKEKL